MGRTTKPRKAYKPKPVGRPVMGTDPARLDSAVPHVHRDAEGER